MSNFTEELFDAIQLITDNAINKISLDKTIICRITDASKKSEGKYRVQNGDVSFYAFSEDATYAKDDEVRVVVPGDDTKQKYILGKYVKDDGSPVNYVSPADSVINISGNILSDNGNADRGFIAAKNAKSTIEIITNMANAGNILGTTVYDTLVIQGDFRTLLQEDSSGEYGIDVIIYGTKNDIVTAQSYTLSSADMFGNPYNFQIYTPQAKAFSLPESLGEEIEVIGVKVAFYQRGFSKQQLLNYDNVLIRNLSIWFGSDTSKVEDKTSKIYTTDSLSYKYYDPTEITNQKTIKLLWYKKDENDKFIECDFDGESNGFTLLENQQIDNKIKAQMGKEDGPKTKRQLYAAAALQDNKSVSSSLVKLLGSDLQLLIRNMESEAGLVSGSLQLTDGKTPLYKIGSTIDQYTSALGTWLTNNSSPNGEWKASPDKNIDQFVNTNVISFLDTFFTSVPSEMSNSTGTFEIYKAKWQVLRKKIKIIYKKLNVTSFGGNNFAQMTSGAWLEDFSTEASKETAAADPKYSCFWFVYDEQYDDDNVRVSVAGEHWKSIEEMDNLTEITYDCDPVLKTQQFKCIVFEDANYYESNILEFTNSDDIPNGATLDQADSLVLVHGAKYSRDNYLLYGDDGYLIENRDSSLIRTIACEYDGIKAGNEALNGATVYWYLPSVSTMLRKAYTNDNDYKTKCGLTLQTQGAAASKYPNHYCYSRTITYDETEETFDSSNEFYYCLAEFYEPNASDNSIICEVYLIDETKQTANDPVFARKWFTIGQRGTCGTGYTLSVTHAEDQIATTNSNNLILNIKLFDESGNEVPLDKSNNEKYTVEWLNHEGSTKDSFNLDEDVLTIYAGHYGILKISKSIFITDSTGTNKRQIDLSILYAIPWASSEEYLFSGCTKVIYTTLGTLDYTSMYKTPYSLTTRDGVDQEATWRIVLKNDASKDESYYPQLRNNCLLPASMYLTGLRGWCYVEAVSSSVSLWKQPIIIMQGKYGSSVLNDWDGSFQIDENAGTVMGTMFAAGKKTSNNTFEGVIMGDVQVGLNDYSQGKIGLYGYNDGVQSFGFKVDGTAFIGKSGKGQIIFDGNQGIIGDAGENMEINFTDGTIKATKFTLDARSNNYTTGLYMTNGMGQSDNPVFWVKQDNNNQISYENNRIIIAASGDGGKVIIDSLGQLNNSYFYAGNDNNYIQLTATGLNILTKKIIIDALVGEETKTGLYLDSSKATFKLISSNNWITFENGSLDIATNKILINAWVGSAGLYINTAPNTEASSKEKYYFIVGKDEDNCIRLSSGEEGLDIKTKKIIIDAWDEDSKKGIYINSAPGAGQNLFSVGFDVDNYISFDSKNNFIIRAQNLFIESQTETARVYIDTYTDNAVAFSVSADVKARSAGGEGRFFVYKDGAILLHSSLASGNFITLDTHNTSTESDWPFSITDNFRIDWDGNVEANALYLQANGSNGFIYFHSKDEAESLTASNKRYLRYENGGLFLMNAPFGVTQVGTYLMRTGILATLNEKIDGWTENPWEHLGNAATYYDKIIIASNMVVASQLTNKSLTFTFENKSQLIIKDGAQLVIEASAGNLEFLSSGITLYSSSQKTDGITIKNDGSNILSVGDSSTTLKIGSMKLSQSSLIFTSGKITNGLVDIGSTSISIMDDSGLTTQISGSSISVAGKKLGKLAFTDYVKKKLDVTMSGKVTLEKSIADDLISYSYTIVNSKTYVEPTYITITEADVGKEIKTGGGYYSYNTGTATGKRYMGSSTTISISETVTLKGISDEIEFGPSDTDTGTESITIAGTQQ